MEGSAWRAAPASPALPLAQMFSLVPKNFLGYFCVSWLCYNTAKAVGQPAVKYNQRYPVVVTPDDPARQRHQITTVISQ
jgi:hypothetical protein